MRRLVAFSLVAIIGCGGSSSGTTVAPPPPSSPSTTPATALVQAGAGQQGLPGTALPIKPAVLVHDSAGQPVSGVTVQFAVDSGGGSLSATSAVSGSNGVATGGTWTLGPAEGRNTLTITAGSLAPFTIAATAAIVGASYPVSTVPTGGGSITVPASGPIQGFELDIPANAYTASLQATVSYASNTSITRTPTMNPVSPIITISTAMTQAAAPLTIHITAPTPAGTFPVIMVYDPGTGNTESLATVSWDATGVTALLPTLNGTQILAPPTASLQGGSFRAGSVRTGSTPASLATSGVVVIDDAIPMNILMQDYDSGFRPGTDDWEFPPTVTELMVATGRYNTLGMAATALWYYTARPGPSLNGHFQEYASVPLSDRKGLRWSSVVTSSDPTILNQLNAGLIARAPRMAQFDQNQFLVVRSRFARGAENGAQPRPQFVQLLSADGLADYYAIVYRVTGTRLYISDAFFPGDQTRYLDFPANAAMTPYLGGASGTSALAQPLSFGLSSLLPLDQFTSTYAQVPNGTIGATSFPTYQFQSWVGQLYDTMFVVDTLRFWVQCAQCRYSFASTLSPPPTSNVASGTLYFAPSATPFGTLSANGLLSSTNPAAGTDANLGIVALSAAMAQSPTSNTGAWLDWHTFTIRRLQTSITLAAPMPLVGTPLALTHQVNAALLPSSVNYSWDFGDQTAKVTVANNPATTHTYTAAGSYPVTAQIIDNRNGQVIAQSTTQVTVVTASIQLTISGSWDQSVTPADATYGYTDAQGVRGTLASGIDAVLFSYDFGGSKAGVQLTLYLPAGSNFTVGQTFPQRVSGNDPTAGVFELTLSQNLADVVHSAQSTIGAGGSLTITSITKASNGSTVYGYSLTTGNGAGGTLSATGFGRLP